MTKLNLTFITNNAKGSQSSSKRLKLIKYFKNNLGADYILFLQEIHSTFNGEGLWKTNFRGQVFFIHGSSNFCGVLPPYLGSISFSVKEQATDRNGRILILDATIDDEEYVLINF